jgi:hypothetical protein
MRFTMLLAGAATVVALPVSAQTKEPDSGDRTPRADCSAPMRHMVTSFFNTSDENRAVLGIGTTSGGMRDTLGLLVTEVTSGGPAEKAGIEEGDRLASVNSTELRLSAADAQDQEMRGLMARRLIRVLAKLKPGDVATLRVSADGKTRDVKVTTVKASELFKDYGILRLGAWDNKLGALKMEQAEEQLEDAGTRLQDLGDQMRDFHFEMPSNAGSDFEILTPPADAPDAPRAPAAPHFMRILAPVAPLPPLPPEAPRGQPLPAPGSSTM